MTLKMVTDIVLIRHMSEVEWVAENSQRDGLFLFSMVDFEF